MIYISNIGIKEGNKILFKKTFFWKVHSPFIPVDPCEWLKAWFFVETFPLKYDINLAEQKRTKNRDVKRIN